MSDHDAVKCLIKLFPEIDLATITESYYAIKNGQPRQLVQGTFPVFSRSDMVPRRIQALLELVDPPTSVLGLGDDALTKAIADKTKAIAYYAHDLPNLPDASVQLICCVYLRDHRLAELARVLAPNGVIVIKQHDSTPGKVYHALRESITLFYERGCGEPDNGPLQYVTRAALENEFRAVGLVPRIRLGVFNAYRSYITVFERVYDSFTTE
jgi:ubiquinone/menaquinone biosynthesis C-methylase UbiE